MKKGIVLSSVTGTLLVATTAFGQASDAVIYDNGAAGYNAGVGASSQFDEVYPFDSQAADDFVLDNTADYTLTGVSWTGLFFNGSPLPTTSDFNIIIYADAGGDPTGGPLDPTGTALAVFTLSGANIQRGDNLDGTFSYSADLGGSIDLAVGTKYWLAIQSINTFPPQWGWVGSNTQTGENYHQGFPLLGLNYWTDQLNGDLDFRLHGVKVPAPAVLALFGVAGIARRRRRA